MSVSYGPKSPAPQPDWIDLSREQVLDIFRTAESDALRRHTALVGSDGAGHLHIICGCERNYSPEAWVGHLCEVARFARRPKPNQR